MPQSRTRSVGLAVQKASLAVASVAQAHGAAGVSLGTLGTRQGAIAKRLRQLQSQGQPRVFVYEAGPGGSWLSRSLMQKGDVCGGVCPTPAQPIVLQEYVQPVTAQPARLPRLAHALRDQVQTWRFPPVVEALQAFRGVPGTVAVPTVAARGDLTRFNNPRQRMPYLGLTPSA